MVEDEPSLGESAAALELERSFVRTPAGQRRANADEKSAGGAEGNRPP